MRCLSSWSSPVGAGPQSTTRGTNNKNAHISNARMLQFSDYKINAGLFEKNLDLLAYAYALPWIKRIYYQWFHLGGLWTRKRTISFVFCISRALWNWTLSSRVTVCVCRGYLGWGTWDHRPLCLFVDIHLLLRIGRDRDTANNGLSWSIWNHLKAKRNLKSTAITPSRWEHSSFQHKALHA